MATGGGKADVDETPLAPVLAELHSVIALSIEGHEAVFDDDASLDGSPVYEAIEESSVTELVTVEEMYVDLLSDQVSGDEALSTISEAVATTSKVAVVEKPAENVGKWAKYSGAQLRTPRAPGLRFKRKPPATTTTVTDGDDTYDSLKKQFIRSEAARADERHQHHCAEHELRMELLRAKIRQAEKRRRSSSISSSSEPAPSENRE